jgi:hypothetical protein
MYRRICDGLTPKVAEAFGHRRSGTEELERQLRDAVAGKDWERAKRLSGQLAKQGRQAGSTGSSSLQRSRERPSHRPAPRQVPI